jgi:hypothetical protein
MENNRENLELRQSGEESVTHGISMGLGNIILWSLVILLYFFLASQNIPRSPLYTRKSNTSLEKQTIIEKIPQPSLVIEDQKTQTSKPTFTTFKNESKDHKMRQERRKHTTNKHHHKKIEGESV